MVLICSLDFCESAVLVERKRLKGRLTINTVKSQGKAREEAFSFSSKMMNKSETWKRGEFKAEAAHHRFRPSDRLKGSLWKAHWAQHRLKVGLHPVLRWCSLCSSEPFHFHCFRESPFPWFRGVGPVFAFSRLKIDFELLKVKAELMMKNEEFEHFWGVDHFGMEPACQAEPCSILEAFPDQLLLHFWSGAGDGHLLFLKADKFLASTFDHRKLDPTW